MRTFIGIILGCLLTVAAAYVHDSMATSAVSDGMPATTSNTLVNWDVAARKWSYVKDSAHTAWVKLQSATNSLSKNGA